MTRIHCSEGELCLQTLAARCQAAGSVPAKATATNGIGVMSRLCAHCRFHKYVNVTPTCWLWTGTFYSHKGKRTYGQFWIDERRIGAHVASYILHVGPVPDGLDVLHSCDVKACVNPAHLRPGTHTENIREAFAKLPDDYFAGERNGRARLTWPQVHAIRAAAARGAKKVDLAAQYRVSAAQISSIVRGKRWIEPTSDAYGLNGPGGHAA